MTSHQKLARYDAIRLRSGQWRLSVVLSHLGEMLYPLLNLGASFPHGSHSETVDSLLMNGSIRVRRAISEVEPSLMRHRTDTCEMSCQMHYKRFFSDFKSRKLSSLDRGFANPPCMRHRIISQNLSLNSLILSRMPDAISNDLPLCCVEFELTCW